MANVWDEFDKAYDLDGLNKDLKDNENNSGNYREVPHGTYEVAVNKMELVKSKKGKPMVSIWFKIAAGEFAGSLIFYNQVIDNSFGIHSNNDLLRSMDLDCVNNLGEHDHDVFQSFGQYGNLLMDAKEEIDDAGLTFQLAYTEGKNGFHKYKIEEVFEA